MTHKFYFIIALLLLPLIGRAQLNKELLRNGGFEEYAQPVAPPVNNDDDEGDEEEEEEEEAPKEDEESRLIVSSKDLTKLSMLLNELEGRGFKCEIKE